MGKKMHTVGLVMKSLQADFFKDMQRGAEQFVDREKCCELISTGTQSQTEVERQIELVEELTARGVDAIVVVPIDSKALVAPVAKAVKAGIKVVNIDIKLDDELLTREGVKVDFVGPDNLAASYAVAERLASTLPSGTPVAVIEGLPVADNARQRKAGADRAIREHGLDCVASVPANWEIDTAQDVFGKILSEHPEVKGVFSCNDAMAIGVINVLKGAGKAPGEIAVTGFDNDAVMRPLLDDGWLMATVDAYGSQMAVEGIRHALKLLECGADSIGDKATTFDIIA
ncbi:MAG: substrate-binding domain-containing protein [Duncaniella sp.]|nr:substrate-binding domain-containing protein [Duncaniella sp.]